MPAPKKNPAKVHIIAENQVQAKCVCGWAGLVFTGKTSLVSAITEAGIEVKAHKCPPKPRKPRAEKVKSAKV